MSIYTDRGFESRRDYIEQVALTYGIPYADVLLVASLLGSSEDFDGLLSMCADEAGTGFIEVG